jgi:hypothetical protein
MISVSSMQHHSILTSRRPLTHNVGILLQSDKIDNVQATDTADAVSVSRLSP